VSAPTDRSRRTFLSGAAGLGALSVLGCRVEGSRTPGEAPPAPFEISLAQWSLHRELRSGRMTNLDFPAVTRREFDLGICEYVNSFFKEQARDEAYLRELRKRCADAGVASRLIMVDGEGELAHADDSARLEAVRNHHRWIDCAAFLGCMAIRVNAAGTGDPSEMQRRAADSLVRLAERGADGGVAILVENHGGPSSDGAWLAGVMRLADHPRVGTLPDFGNFHLGDGRWYDRYRGVAELMPFARAVSAKSHEFDAAGNEVRTDYRRMLGIVLAAGYRGPIGIEYEGDAHSELDGIRLTKALLERVRAELA
jgi:L-ribulose-5-phosphate 3-epimerase